MIAGLFALLLNTQIPLAPVDPQLDWKTMHTDHFKIHYPEELTEVANRLGNIVEPVHQRLTAQMKWIPSGPVHIILYNNTDAANGFSTPIPYNSIYLNIAPPEAGSSLDYYDEWLTILFSHEFTHSIHIDMVHGINQFLRFFLGRAVVPNAAQPQWLIEGYAVYNESLYTHAGRGRSSYVDMHIRTAALEGELLPISRATYWNDIYPFGNAAYWYGVAFYQYIAEKYGAEKWVEFAHTNASWIIPGWFNFKTRKIFGKSFSRLWDEWQEEVVAKSKEETKQYHTKFEFLSFGENKLQLAGQGCWGSSTKMYAVVQTEDDKTQLVSFEFHEDQPEPKMEVLEKNFSPADLHCEGKALYYSKYAPVDAYNLYADVWRYDLNLKKTHKLTHGLRLKDPFVHEGWIYGVRTAALESEIIRIRLPEIFLTGDEEGIKKFKATDEDYRPDILLKGKDFATMASPQISPDGTTMAFSMFRENGFRDLYTMDLSTKNISRLTQDAYLEYSPQWVSNEQLIFTSDRRLPETDIRVFNIFRLNIKSGQLEQLTDTWTGIYWPQQSGENLVFGKLSTTGFELARGKTKSIRTEALVKEPLPNRRPPILTDIQSNIQSEPETSEYQIGTTLLPRYLIPVGYYTEDDSLVGALTGSNDPLGFHRWIGIGYYVVNPKRPGGALAYSYSFGPINWNTSLSAGISNYGKVLITAENNQLFLIDEDYYERNYRASTGISYRLIGDSGPLPFFFSHDISVSDRRPLLGVPDEALRDPVQLQSGTLLRVFPDTGQQIGFSTTAVFSGGLRREIQGIAPSSGRSVRLELEYSPKIPGMEFHTLTSSLTYKEYFEFIRFHSLAFYLTGGVQWLDQLYQSTFRIGGSLGDTAFNTFNRRNIPLRGLPSTALRGEGATAASLEYRFPILKHVPGWGTAPVWFKNFSGVFFNDVGQAFQIKDEATALQLNPEDFSFKRFTWSLGAELRSDVGLYYGPPITFRLGYGYVLFLEGERVKGPRLDEVYFQVGSSF